MHQIVCRLGLHPRPRWGSLQRFPRPPSWIIGGLLLREGRGGERTGGEGTPCSPVTPPSHYILDKGLRRACSVWEFADWYLDYSFEHTSSHHFAFSTQYSFTDLSWARTPSVRRRCLRLESTDAFDGTNLFLSQWACPSVSALTAARWRCLATDPARGERTGAVRCCCCSESLVRVVPRPPCPTPPTL